VDLEHLGLTRLDPNVLQHRHQTLAERVKLLARDGQALKLVRYTTGQDNIDEARYRLVL
jgi:hypothetical protein